MLSFSNFSGVSGKGPPLTLAWDPIEEERYDIDSYEKMRTIHYPRRRRVQILSPLMRESRLLKSGNKRSDIRASTRAANKLRKQRNSSLRSSNRKGTIFGLFKPASWEDFINTDKDAFRKSLTWTVHDFMGNWSRKRIKVFGWRLDIVKPQNPTRYPASHCLHSCLPALWKGWSYTLLPQLFSSWGLQRWR